MPLPSEAGPEMDRAVWIALWSKDREGDAYIEDRPDHLAPGEAPHCQVCWSLEGGSFEDWAPSSRIDHAWAVVEKLEADGWLLDLYSQGGCWSASMEKSPDVFTERCVAKTAQLAICRAALAAAR